MIHRRAKKCTNSRPRYHLWRCHPEFWLFRTLRAQPLCWSTKKPMQNGIEGCFPKKSSLTHWVGVRCLPRPALATFSLLLSMTNAEEPGNRYHYSLAPLDWNEHQRTKKACWASANCLIQCPNRYIYCCVFQVASLIYFLSKYLYTFEEMALCCYGFKIGELSPRSSWRAAILRQ